MDNILSIYGLIFIIMFAIVLIRIVISAETKGRIRDLKGNSLEVTPEEFFRLRNKKKAFNNRKNISTDMDFAGIYIIYNKTRNMYYIGQSKNVFKRVNSHFTGKGNGDVYADYKYGNQFTISMIALEGSGFSTLNALEKNAISTYNAYSKGYNKTKGNRG